MNKLLKLSICGMFASGLFGGALSAEESKSWSVDTNVGFFSDYMWRGFNLFNGASIQPSVTANYDTGYGVISGNTWVHLSADQDSGQDRFTETDYTLKYSLDVDKISLSAGGIWYRYPSSDLTDTEEVFGSISYDYDLLNPVLTVYRDVGEFENWYYEATISHEFEKVLESEATLTPYSTFGFASDAEKVYDGDGLVQVTVGSSVSFDMGPIAVAPNVNYTFKVDDATVNNFWMGTNVSYSF
jgi:hypothetical protein